MKVSVDFDRCESNALCMQTLPEVFEVRDDGYLYLLVEEIKPEWAERAREAVALCPKQAISVEE
ncbi:MAG TPA: ferredoxin [Jatrophihabitans sp.]|jgi:ferredoxin